MDYYYYYKHRPYDLDYYDRYRWYYRPYFRRFPYYGSVYDSNISNLNQNIINSGNMTDVYQNAIINQLKTKYRRGA